MENYEKIEDVQPASYVHVKTLFWFLNGDFLSKFNYNFSL